METGANSAVVQMDLSSRSSGACCQIGYLKYICLRCEGRDSKDYMLLNLHARIGEITYPVCLVRLAKPCSIWTISEGLLAPGVYSLHLGDSRWLILTFPAVPRLFPLSFLSAVSSLGRVQLDPTGRTLHLILMQGWDASKSTKSHLESQISTKNGQ